MSVCYCLFSLTFVYFSVCVSFVCSFVCVCLRVFVSFAVGLAAGVTTDLVAVYPVKVVPDRSPGCHSLRFGGWREPMCLGLASIYIGLGDFD